MRKKSLLIFVILILAGVFVLAQLSQSDQKGDAMEPQKEAAHKLRLFNAQTGEYEMVDYIVKSEEEWKSILGKDVFHIVREQGTERAFTGELLNVKEDGIFQCAACGSDLFLTENKFESGTGWPSFWKPVAEENVGTEEDNSFFMKRVEVHCARCGAHLGHVFEDGPAPTGLRYCINSKALKFLPQPEK